MEPGFTDLDILITRIRDENSKKYFLDAVKCYKAGALRASLTAGWVALVYDLITKYRELSALGDAEAVDFIRGWDDATAAKNVTKLSRMEASILEEAVNKAQIVNRLAHTHLERLREDRHLCAHPAFSTEAKLFEPSPELVRLHLFNAVDFVLSQEPQQGKAILDLFDADVQSTGFPTNHARILDYVEQRYLKRVRPQNIRNFGIVLAKSLLRGVPPQWDTQPEKIISSLVAVRERSADAWPEIFHSIVRMIDSLEPEKRPRAIIFIAALPDFWRSIQEHTRTSLEFVAHNIAMESDVDYRIFTAVKLPQFREPLQRAIAQLDEERLRAAIDSNVLEEFWPHAINIYKSSRSFRGSEANFGKFITPFAGYLNSQQHDELLDAVNDNSQNIHAAGTKDLLLGMFRSASVNDLPNRDARSRFYERIRGQRSVSRYSDVFDLFEMDGWTRGLPPLDDDE